jgi:hypothetical protein
VFVNDFTENSLVDVALLKRLLTRALAGDVSRVSQDRVHQCYSGYIVNVAEREREVNIVDIE